MDAKQYAAQQLRELVTWVLFDSVPELPVFGRGIEVTRVGKDGQCSIERTHEAEPDRFPFLYIPSVTLHPSDDLITVSFLREFKPLTRELYTAANQRGCISPADTCRVLYMVPDLDTRPWGSVRVVSLHDLEPALSALLGSLLTLGYQRG